MRLLEYIFSIKNKGLKKVLTILGIKITFKNKYVQLRAQNEELITQSKTLAVQNKKLADTTKNLIEKTDTLKNDLKNLETKYNDAIAQTNKQFNTYKQNCDKTLALLSREKNLANWKINFLSEYVDCKVLKQQTINQRFFYNGNNYLPNIGAPRTFNEKILWLRENYLKDNPLTDFITNKLSFKRYIEEKLGQGHTIPLLGQWSNPYDIDYNTLPDKFVLKSTWGGDGTQVLIVKDKSKIDIEKTNRKIHEWIVEWGNPYYYGYNTIFKNIKPCIIAEEYLEGLGTEFFDYKIFCFNGEPKIIYVASNWAVEHKMKYYDTEWNELNLKYSDYEDFKQEKPKNLDLMLDVAKKLSKQFPFVRVDFYDLKDKIMLSEMTFTPGGGFGKYEPVEWDYKMGEMLDISYLMEKKHD